MVRMYHDDPSKTGGPTTADVPEAAIGWMQEVGWYLKPDEDVPEAKEEKPEPKKRSRKKTETD